MTDLNALRYTDEHEWIAADGDTVTIGITDYAADKLGDVVFVLSLIHISEPTRPY